MKPEQQHIDKIKDDFDKMQSKEDLLAVLNFAASLLFEKAPSFQLKQLTYYANPKISGERYRDFTIKKRSGDVRTIHAPVKVLKALQRTLAFILQCVFEPHRGAMGFIRGKSIVDNAKLHIGNIYVYNIDLKDFFPNIDQARVWKCLQIHPFNLGADSIEQKLREDHQIRSNLYIRRVSSTTNKNGRQIGYASRYEILIPENASVAIDTNDFVITSNKNGKLVYKVLASFKSEEEAIKEFKKQLDKYFLSNKTGKIEIANIIASLCCTEMVVERKNQHGEWIKEKRNVLPQGAPTSPVITNIVCQKLDRRLNGVAKRFGLKYSRYADDITFSSMHNVYQAGSDFLQELHRIILEQGFHIKESKTRLQKKGYRQEVTGLLVNEKVNVQQRYIKQLRMWLYYWERYGYERAYSLFLQQYMADKGNMVKGKPDMANVVAGKLDYLKMVKGGKNELYLKLKQRFDKMTVLQNPVDQLLAIWENEGIEKAMNAFYNQQQAHDEK